MVTISRWNVLDRLDSEERIMGYLAAAVKDIEEGECDAGFFLACLADAAKARAINQLAKETGIDRKRLCSLGMEDSGADAPKIDAGAFVRVTRAFAAPVQV
jgi:probable addiction module antidote protein